MTMPTATLTSRPSRADDDDFRRELFGAPRLAELLDSGVPAGRAEPLVAMQYHGFSAHLGAEATDQTTWLLDGRPVAWVACAARPDQVRLLWVAVATRAQGAGIGHAVLRPVLERAHAQGLPVTLHVAPDNAPARALYARLGFVEASGGESDVDLFLSTTPASLPVQEPSHD